MAKKLIVFLFFVLIVFMACAKKNELKVTKKNGITYVENPKIDLCSDELIKELDVNLSSLEEVDITSIGKIVEHRDRIYILDETLDQISIFDLTGNFIKKFGGKGKAPGELLGSSDMEIFNNQIYISEVSNSRFSIFSLDGKFINSLKYDFLGLPGDFGFSKNGIMHNKNNFAVKKNKNNNLISKFEIKTELHKLNTYGSSYVKGNFLENSIPNQNIRELL